MNASPFQSRLVEASSEITRIAALPRRVWTDEAATELAALLTRELKTPAGTMALRPVQAIALYEAMETGGLFGPIYVGGGKTLLSLLLPSVLEAKRPVLLIPAALVEKTWRDAQVLKEHFRIATNVQIVSYEMLGLVQSAQKLDYIEPDLIVADECFVAGTPIRTASGVRPIESVRVGDFVATGQGLLPVTGAWNRESEDLYDVAFADHRYTCTGSHPFLTTIGWRAARDLTVGDEVVCDVQAAVCSEEEEAAFLRSQVWRGRPSEEQRRDQVLRDVRGLFRLETLPEEDFLLSQVQARKSEDSRKVVREREISEGRRGTLFFEGCLEENEAPQSDAFAGSARGRSEGTSRPRRLETSRAGRQRPSDAGAATSFVASAWTGVGSGETLSLGCERDTGVPCGHGARDVQDRGGGRWAEPSRRQGESEGRSQGRFLGGERVARITCVQRRGAGTPGSRARVYNFSVDGPETYVLGGGEIVHNCHYLKNHRAGRTRRVTRYMNARPSTRFVGVSGTVMRKSIRDFAHILRWALKDKAPIPATDDETSAWADAVDETVNPIARRKLGALLNLARGACPQCGCAIEECECVSMLVRARRVFQSRLLETPGVVASAKTDGVACSLRVSALEYEAAPITSEHFTHVRKTMTTPDGWAFAEPMVLRMYLRQLALGFHGVWSPRPPQEWLSARREWASFVCDVLAESNVLDTELQVARAVDAGELRTDTLEAWRAVRDSFQIQPADVWHDDSALQACVKWMEREKGIVWCEHRFFARRLAQITGATYYGANGLSDAGESITLVKPGKAIIASVQANSTGRNLQMFSTNLVTSCPPSAQIVEQLIGRTHREGQEADEVTVDILLGCYEHVDSFERALDSARAAADTMGHDQKILLADLCLPNTNNRTGPLWR